MLMGPLISFDVWIERKKVLRLKYGIYYTELI